MALVCVVLLDPIGWLGLNIQAHADRLGICTSDYSIRVRLS